MEYIAVNIVLDPHQEETEGILVAELDAIGYEGFQTEEHVMTAYVPAKTYNETHLRIVLNTYGIQDFTKTYIPYKNWNADWELRFSPILLEAGKGCSVRAPKNGSMVPVWPEVAYKLVIKPELAFGTGHHPTTLMMMEALLTMEQAGLIKNKRVLDFGTGTGILAILAAKMGAAAPYMHWIPTSKAFAPVEKTHFSTKPINKSVSTMRDLQPSRKTGTDSSWPTSTATYS